MAMSYEMTHGFFDFRSGGLNSIQFILFCVGKRWEQGSRFSVLCSFRFLTAVLVPRGPITWRDSEVLYTNKAI